MERAAPIHDFLNLLLTDGATVFCPKVKFIENSWKIFSAGRDKGSISRKVEFFSVGTVLTGRPLENRKGFFISKEEKKIRCKNQKIRLRLICFVNIQNAVTNGCTTSNVTIYSWRHEMLTAAIPRQADTPN